LICAGSNGKSGVEIWDFGRLEMACWDDEGLSGADFLVSTKGTWSASRTLKQLKAVQSFARQKKAKF
jgi:hypothetical protein